MKMHVAFGFALHLSEKWHQHAIRKNPSITEQMVALKVGAFWRLSGLLPCAFHAAGAWQTDRRNALLISLKWLEHIQVVRTLKPHLWLRVECWMERPALPVWLWINIWKSESTTEDLFSSNSNKKKNEMKLKSTLISCSLKRHPCWFLFHFS